MPFHYLPEPAVIRVTDSSRIDDFVALARMLREQQQGGVTVVYAPSTTTITTMTPIASPAPAELIGQAPTRPVTARPRYTLGEVIAYSGMTLMGGSILSELVTVRLRVPMLVPVLGGVTAVVGMLAALGGFELDYDQRHDR
jgi:hypothetical protein